MALHDQLLKHFRPGDRIVYTGNYIGGNAEAAFCIDEILTFRRMAMSIAGVKPTDFAYLRGKQEEMLSRVMQLQFAPDPAAVFHWMLDQGLAGTLQSYNIDVREGLAACSGDAARIARWTDFVRAMVSRRAGHDAFLGQVRRAAFTQCDMKQKPSANICAPLLFVSAGVSTDRDLENQGDRFWWGGDDFSTITTAYRPFARVVRGYDPRRTGLNINCVTASLDNNCGYGGSLVCAGFASDASVLDVFEA